MRQLKNLEELRAYLKEQLEEAAYFTSRIDNLIQILMGNIYEEYPATIEAFLLKKGYTQEQISQMAPEQILETLIKLGAGKPERSKNLTIALDLLFEARYGWPEGTAGKLTPAEAYLALENAMEFDAPEKPSIWEVTK
jgi:RNAse (barnase) inhibitor barstar